jgi:diguanylate cyclase (GGDEF)-like protein/putative nucleotidyltransferase with HDIG domain
MRRPSIPTLAVWFSVAVLCAISVSVLHDLSRATQQSGQAERHGRVAEAYRQAHAAHAGQEAALNAGDPAAHQTAAITLRNALRRAEALDPAAHTTVERLLRDHAAYMIPADLGVRGSSAGAAGAREHSEGLEEGIGAATEAASHRSLELGVRAHATQRRVVRAGAGLLLAAMLIFGALGVMVRQHRRRLDAARAVELAHLSEMASSDPLTGLRNHRVFQEDLSRELQRVGRTGVPLALVLLDLDDLKTLNDNFGHQAGDQRIRALADALRATMRGTDCAYRIGGDEFAVLLPATRAWGALEFTQRLRLALPGFTATAGVAEAERLCARDELIREADMALLGAKRLHQHAAIYTPEMDPTPDTAGNADEHHTRTLASALARAVDAKDSYTRSHCQTVSQLAAVIAAELGFTGDRLARMRLAGLLHDVGKIGVPDAILNKPAALTDEEFAVMQGHSLLGFEIVQAAGLDEEARWVRHHHERVDGRGYPDRLAGDEIPLESRIILVADAFEAMTSDRPYRRAPGAEFAVEELRRGAGSQFDAGVVDALCRVLDRMPEPELVS